MNRRVGQRPRLIEAMVEMLDQVIDDAAARCASLTEQRCRASVFVPQRQTHTKPAEASR